MREGEIERPSHPIDLGIGEQGSVLRLGHRRTHDGDAGGVAKNGAVDEGQVGGAEKVEATGGAAGTRAVEVAGVGIDPEGHVGRFKHQGVGGVGLGTPEEAHGGAEGGLGGRGLVGGKKANSSQNASVDGASAMQERAGSDLYSFSIGGGQWGWGVANKGRR
jgi:hypothetical protein